jgi:IS4 transposase
VGARVARRQRPARRPEGSLRWIEGYERLVGAGSAPAELIDWYRARWEIEMLFNVLKNGCKVGELQLGTIERIERALALYLVAAWRIAHLIRMGRTCPYLDA